jgi:hypothetical protein
MQIIMTDIEFLINDFKGTGDDYKVVAYAQDIEESDMYRVDIYKLGKDLCKADRVSTLYVDSCGGYLEYETPGAKLSELEEYVLGVLFGGIIRGF